MARLPERTMAKAIAILVVTLILTKAGAQASSLRRVRKLEEVRPGTR